MTRTFLDAPPSGRVGRYPRHSFQTKELPFTAVPFMIAPVLPAETLSSLYLEARVVTDPIVNPIIGWKKEFHFFYVRITDLLNDTIRDMFIDENNTDLTATLGKASNSTAFYSAKGGMDYVERCMQRITALYYRDEGVAWNAYTTADGYPIVPIRQDNFLDSLTDKDVMPEGAAISGATDAGDLERLMIAFEHLRAMGIANMTYEDFLRSYGLSIPQKDENKPELIARFSDFAYPSNTVNPADGSAASAVSWVFKNSMRDPKAFKEPGFIVGVSITRPKVYLAGLAGSAANFMSRAFDWAPALLADMPESTLKYFAGDSGPLGDRLTAPDGYWLDMRDLLLYGDQFQNVSAFPASSANPAVVGSAHMLPLPTGDTFNTRFPAEADIKQLFKTPASAFYVKQDGYVSLGIKGRQVDYSVPNKAEA